MPLNKEEHKPSKNIWITTGIFSSHYLLERLPQAGPKLWPSDEEVSSLDDLINQTVYKLYKLTPEESAIMKKEFNHYYVLIKHQTLELS